MTSERFRDIGLHGAWVDLSDRAKWLLTGTDRTRYLNGQVTNDVRKARRDASLHACVTNAKGRMDGDVFIHLSPVDALLLDAEPVLRETLPLRLGKYIVADDVEISDVSEAWKLLHVFGAAAETWRANFSPSGSGVHLVSSERFAVPGADIWIPAAEATPQLEAVFLSAEDAETWRICQGVPRFPNELNEGVFPQEAGLEATAMDFSKGCYIGQEVLSRIKSTGKMPRRMVKFTALDPAPKEWNAIAAARLFLRTDGGNQEAGVVTSACRHPASDRLAGLAFVRQGLEREATLLLAQGEPPVILTEVEITS